MTTDSRTRAAQIYKLMIGAIGMAALIYITLADPPEALLPAYLVFLVLSIVVKRTSVHIARDVEHSLVGVVDLAAILTFGGVVGGWVAAISAAILIDLRAIRRRQVTRQSLFVRPLFNMGLKAFLALLGTWAFEHLGGEIGAATLASTQIVPLVVLILGWFVLDHIGWGVAIWLRDGWIGLLDFFRSIWRYSLLIELAPLPFALIVALTYTVIGWAGFLLLSVMLLAVSWVLLRWADAAGQLEDRIADLETFERVAQALASGPLDVEDQARLVHRCTQELLDPPDFLLGLLSPNQDRLQLACWTINRQMQDPVNVPAAGAMSWLQRHQLPLLLRDFEEGDAPLVPAGVGRLPRSAIYVPMLVKGTLTGLLSVQSPQPGSFDANDMRVLAAIAHQAAISIENARLYGEEQRRANQLAAVAEVGRHLASILDLDELLSTVVRLIRERFGYYHVQVFVLDQDSRQAVFRASSSKELEDMWRQRGREVTPGEGGIIPWVAQTGEPLLANDVAEEPRYTPDDPVLLPDTRAELAVPIRLDETVVGVLDVQSAEHGAFGPEDQFVLTALSDELAVAIDVARLHTATREEAWISTVLLQVAETISRVETTEDTLAAVVRMATLLAGVESCAIWLWGEKAGSVKAVEAHGPTAAWRDAMLHRSVDLDQVPAFRRVYRENLHVTVDAGAPDGGGLAELHGLLRGQYLLIIPLIAKGEFLGLMTADCTRIGDRSREKRIEMIVGIARQAAIAIDSAQVYAQQQVDAYVSTVLLEVARAVGQSRDLDEVLETVVRITPMLVGAGRCVILTHPRLAENDLTVHQRGLPDSELEQIEQRQWQPYKDLLDIARTGRAAMVARGEEWTETLQGRVELIEGSLPLLALPLLAKGVYAGVMIIEYQGVPGRFAERWLRILTGIASQTATAIENDWLRQQDLERERMERELEVAHEIQASFIPANVPPMPGWELATLWRAARQVAGDFYDLFPLSENRVGLVIADVADKGMPAALYMALSRTLIKAIALGGRSAGRVLERANDLIIADAPSDMFVTVFYAQLDLSTSRLTFASGGHNPALLVRSGDAEVVMLKPPGMALGIMQGIQVHEDQVEIGEGDLLVLYTDGITDAINARMESFGMDRLVEVIRSARGAPAQEIIQAVSNAVERHVDGQQPFDDATMIVVKRVIQRKDTEDAIAVAV